MEDVCLRLDGVASEGEIMLLSGRLDSIGRMDFGGGIYGWRAEYWKLGKVDCFMLRLCVWSCKAVLGS